MRLAWVTTANASSSPVQQSLPPPFTLEEEAHFSSLRGALTAAVFAKYFDFYAAYPVYFRHFIVATAEGSTLHADWMRKVEAVDREAVAK